MDDARTPALRAPREPGRGSVSVCTLGGVGGIGMNWTLYAAPGGVVLVDAGTSFAPRDTTGLGAIMPDPGVLAALGPRLKGLVVTHFHEDHVGAIARLWPTYAQCPIHATPFAARMLTERLQDAGVQGEVKVKTFKPGSTLTVGPFSIETIAMAHSTPDCVGLVMRAEGRTIWHTGDWKVDPEPGIGSVTDFDAIRRLGRQGVDLMLCDSTGAGSDAPQTSEASVRRAMQRVFDRARGMVFVSSFGSNVARMASVAFAAKAAHRQVALAGSALKKNARAAQELGLLKGVPPFLEHADKLRGTERRGCVLMLTGTQGEENASLFKVAADGGPGGDVRLPRIQAGDVVVHSARVIPGNEEYILPILDKLRALGAEVVTADDLQAGDPVHVTGHPCRTDLEAMYAAARPRLSMPVHGGPDHLAAHAALAKGLGVPATIPTNGTVFELGDELVAVGRVSTRLVVSLEDGEGTLVGWDEASRTPTLGEGDAERIERQADRDEAQRQRSIAKAMRRIERDDERREGRKASTEDVRKGARGSDGPRRRTREDHGVVVAKGGRKQRDGADALPRPLIVERVGRACDGRQVGMRGNAMTAKGKALAAATPKAKSVMADRGRTLDLDQKGRRSATLPKVATARSTVIAVAGPKGRAAVGVAQRADAIRKEVKSVVAASHASTAAPPAIKAGVRKQTGSMALDQSFIAMFGGYQEMGRDGRRDEGRRAGR